MSTLAILEKIHAIYEREICASINAKLYERGRILPGEMLCDVQVVVPFVAGERKLGEHRERMQFFYPDYNGILPLSEPCAAEACNE